MGGNIKHMTNYNSNDNRFDGRCFLEDVEIKLQKRLEEIGQSLSDGQKEIDNMQEYYWENYTDIFIILSDFRLKNTFQIDGRYIQIAAKVPVFKHFLTLHHATFRCTSYILEHFCV